MSEYRRISVLNAFFLSLYNYFLRIILLQWGPLSHIRQVIMIQLVCSVFLCVMAPSLSRCPSLSLNFYVFFFGQIKSRSQTMPMDAIQLFTCNLNKQSLEIHASQCRSSLNSDYPTVRSESQYIVQTNFFVRMCTDNELVDSEIRTWQKK